MMKVSMGYSSHHHWGCLFTYWLIFVMACLWTFMGKLNIDTWLLVAWCVIPYWLKSLHLLPVASLFLCVTEWAGMWLYSSPLETLVVVVITGTDRTVISYININSLILCDMDYPCLPSKVNPFPMTNCAPSQYQSFLSSKKHKQILCSKVQ